MNNLTKQSARAQQRISLLKKVITFTELHIHFENNPTIYLYIPSFHGIFFLLVISIHHSLSLSLHSKNNICRNKKNIMSTQPQQQPVVVYPDTVAGQPPPGSYAHSNGSFGTVFIVLAVISVISAVACCLGKLCNKSQGNKNSKPSKQSQQNPNFRPKERGRERERERERRREGDLEFGFEKGLPTGGRPSGNGDGRGHKPSENGHMKAETFTVDGGHLKPGP